MSFRKKRIWALLYLILFSLFIDLYAVISTSILAGSRDIVGLNRIALFFYPRGRGSFISYLFRGNIRPIQKRAEGVLYFICLYIYSYFDVSVICALHCMGLAWLGVDFTTVCDGS